MQISTISTCKNCQINGETKKFVIAEAEVFQNLKIIEEINLTLSNWDIVSLKTRYFTARVKKAKLFGKDRSPFSKGSSLTLQKSIRLRLRHVAACTGSSIFTRLRRPTRFRLIKEKWHFLATAVNQALSSPRIKVVFADSTLLKMRHTIPKYSADFESKWEFSVGM